MSSDVPTSTQNLAAYVELYFDQPPEGVDASTAAGAGMLTSGIHDLLHHRDTKGRTVVVEELNARAEKELLVANDDAVYAAIYRYRRAALEGAARVNLRLLARIMIATVLSGDTTPDRYLVYADIIAALTPEEVTLIATMLRIDRRMLDTGDSVEEQLASGWRALKQAMVPDPYPSAAALQAACSQATRSGLVLPQTAAGIISYHTSPLMDLLEDLASFAQALQYERDNAEG